MINIHSIAQRAGFEISEEVSFTKKEAIFSNVPAGLHPVVEQRIKEIYPNGLFLHQAKAIEYGLSGHSVCVATPTASGKTLIFTSIALSRLLTDRDAGERSVILALYPAKALLHDQELKWKEAINGTALNVGIIDGGVPTVKRPEILAASEIILMTPDILHAWVMSHLDKVEIREWLSNLKMIVLDEAHIYDGVFGTNMAYLFRRIQAISLVSQFLASSATIGDPLGFLKELSGVEYDLIAIEDDGAGMPEKKIMLCRIPIRRTHLFRNELLKEYAAANGEYGRFLMFVDSRKKVEEIAAEGQRSLQNNEGQETDQQAVFDTLDLEDMVDIDNDQKVLPYRAGYEEEDRERIQAALTTGALLGVVTTSALELGIDIGEVELVVMLGEPPSVKSFWQRAGRAGRKNAGRVVLLDLDGRVTSMGLTRYLDRLPEPNWIYLDNEYLQYANALCAADEKRATLDSLYSNIPLKSLPSGFTDLLENELVPMRSIPHDLYPLKQQANSTENVQYAFPLRSGIEKTYTVTCRNMPNQSLGKLSYSQLMREAFPGAIYRYLAKPYLVSQIKHAKSEIITTRIRGIGRTTPEVQTAVFPQFNDQMYYIRKSESSFVIECHVQASERVIGFELKIGNNKKKELYGVGNKYSQKPLCRFINTTGVCFYFPEEQLQREKIAKYICLAFCKICSVQDRDVGWGSFLSQSSPLGTERVKGFAIYDSTNGSLRLTRQIPSRMNDILAEAQRLSLEECASHISAAIGEIQRQLESFGPAQENICVSQIFETGSDSGWVTVVADNQPALCHDGQSHINEDVIVLNFLYTPTGIRYNLKSSRDDITWQVIASMIHPVNGITKCIRYNINTGETEVL